MYKKIKQRTVEVVNIQKRKWVIIFITLFIGIIVIVSLAIKVHSSNISAKYYISNNSKDIDQNLTYWLNRGDGKFNPTLIKVVHLGKSDTYIAYFKNESDILGIVKMKEGPNRITNS